MTEIAGVRIGAEVSGYRVDELIGRGGMGEVYRAWDERLVRNVALKILIPRLADDDAFRERLLRESRLAASLDHPNVVPVYDAGEADARFFLAMRYVEGTDLLGARPLPVTVPSPPSPPSRVEREPASLGRIAACRAPSPGTVTAAL